MHAKLTVAQAQLGDLTLVDLLCKVPVISIPSGGCSHSERTVDATGREETINIYGSFLAVTERAL